MKLTSLRFVVMVAALLLPLPGYAQEAVIGGTVTDGTGGVLPGVVVTAVHEATGNSFEAVTDANGAYRLAVRIGGYRITAALPGFASLTRTGLEVQVGQQVGVNLQMTPAGLEETVTVTGEAPLIDVTTSSLGANIDARQVQELPVQGRNWMDLTMLAPGSRQNTQSQDMPAGRGQFQLNVDGQQVTNMIVESFGQPRFSRDTIAEFEFVSNRFDARQGRSSGVQVNAITKSGTNTPGGSFSSYFRSDRFNARDFIEQRKIPYSDQQYSVTFGGPLRRDRVHFFANYEYEREPQTATHSGPYTSFNFDQRDTRREHKGGVRLDYQISPETRLMGRMNSSSHFIPFANSGGAARHPSAQAVTTRVSNQVTARLTQVLSSQAINEVSGGYAGFYWEILPVLEWSGHPNASTLGTPGGLHGSPIINLQAYTIGQGHGSAYQHLAQHPYSIRDDFTYLFTKGGRHELKLGTEYLYSIQPTTHCNRCMGVIDARGGRPPANLEELFPVWNDLSTWNLNALAPIVRFYTLGIGKMKADGPITKIAGWVQNDWTVTDNLTLNLGARYDFFKGMYAEYISIPPWLEAGRPLQHDVAPRLGFAYRLTERMALRGGWGMFYGDMGHSPSHWTNLHSGQIVVDVLNDGRPDFVTNPFNGPIPTFEQAVASGRWPRVITSNLAAPNAQVPYSYQSSIGVAQQIGNTMSIEADYVNNLSRHQRVAQDVNVAYNPATGANYPFTDLSRRPVAGWGTVSMGLTEDQNNYHGLQMGFTKRLSNNWQASATYLLSGQWNYQREPVNPGCQHPMTNPAPGEFRCDIPIQLHPVLAAEWYLTGDQRHRATFNGIWQLGYGFQLSGLYFFGDNGRETPTSGVDVLGVGDAGGRLRADGTLIARNSFDRPSLHRVDVRLQRRFQLSNRLGIDVIAEVFNLFNHENYGTFVTNERNAQYGRPSFNSDIAYQPRTMQFGFRTTF